MTKTNGPPRRGAGPPAAVGPSRIELQPYKPRDEESEEEKTSLGRVVVFSDDSNEDDPLTFDSVVDGLGHAWVGKIFANNCRIEAVVDRGDRCLVFRARQTSLDRTVAVKVIRSHLAPERSLAYRARFLRAAQATSRLDHPNIATVHDAGETADGVVYAVMELLKGRNLRRIQRDGPMSVGRALVVIVGIARALGFAHQQGVFHLGLDPSNVFVVPAGSDETNPVRVVGFGAIQQGQAFDEKDTDVTPAYAAPEQIRGAPADQRADFYALGVIAYELLTGGLPFDGPTPMAAALRRLREPAPTMEARGVHVPGGVEYIVRRCMELDPQDRYEVADELIADLEDARRQLAKQVDPSSAEDSGPAASLPPTAAPGSVTLLSRLAPAMVAVAFAFPAGLGIGIGATAAVMTALEGDSVVETSEFSLLPEGTFMGRADQSPIVLTVLHRSAGRIEATLLLREDQQDSSIRLAGTAAKGGSFTLASEDGKFKLMGSADETRATGTYIDGGRRGIWSVDLE